eukprot:4777551-Pleurochrysis_carterae.AAC.3
MSKAVIMMSQPLRMQMRTSHDDPIYSHRLTFMVLRRRAARRGGSQAATIARPSAAPARTLRSAQAHRCVTGERKDRALEEGVGERERKLGQHQIGSQPGTNRG